MAAIGGITLLTLTGGINPGDGEQVEEITRPGVDGIAFRRIGKRGFPFRLQTTLDVESSAQAKAHIISCKSLQGSVVNFTDGVGQTWNNYIVLRVTHTETRRIQTAVGGLSGSNAAYLVSMAWTLQATEVAA